MESVKATVKSGDSWRLLSAAVYVVAGVVIRDRLVGSQKPATVNQIKPGNTRTLCARR